MQGEPAPRTALHHRNDYIHCKWYLHFSSLKPLGQMSIQVAFPLLAFIKDTRTIVEAHICVELDRVMIQVKIAQFTCLLIF